MYFDVIGINLLEGRCCFYGSREKVRDLLQLSRVKALVTSNECEDWQLALTITSQVYFYLLTGTDIIRVVYNLAGNSIPISSHV